MLSEFEGYLRENFEKLYYYLVGRGERPDYRGRYTLIYVNNLSDVVELSNFRCFAEDVEDVPGIYVGNEAIEFDPEEVEVLGLQLMNNFVAATEADYYDPEDVFKLQLEILEEAVYEYLFQEIGEDLKLADITPRLAYQMIQSVWPDEYEAVTFFGGQGVGVDVSYLEEAAARLFPYKGIDGERYHDRATCTEAIVDQLFCQLESGVDVKMETRSYGNVFVVDGTEVLIND